MKKPVVTFHYPEKAEEGDLGTVIIFRTYGNTTPQGEYLGTEAVYRGGKWLLGEYANERIGLQAKLGDSNEVRIQLSKSA